MNAPKLLSSTAIALVFALGSSGPARAADGTAGANASDTESSTPADMPVAAALALTLPPTPP